jgi:Xaa-Pro aminopeptidase
MVDYHRQLLSRLRPGALPQDILAESAAAMRERLDKLDLPDPAYRDGAVRSLEFAGHLSHPVGMSVHDVGDYFNEPLEEGMVFAVDPMMWVPEHQVYIRCEDTVVITRDGFENLTSAAPLTADEIEDAMGEPSPLLPILAERRWWSPVGTPGANHVAPTG